MNNRRIHVMRPSEMFDTFMDDFFQTPQRFGRMLTDDIQVDVSEDDSHVFVDIKAAGFKKEDIEISVENDMLFISGTAKEEQKDEDRKRKYFIKEMTQESFSRGVALPTRVEAEEADAKVEDGIIKITLPKLPESRSKRIEIKAD